MQKHQMYVKIIGEPFLSRVRGYRTALDACHEAWRAFAQQRGASGISGNLNGLIFSDGKAPDGWKKPHKNGYCQPKKGHAEQAAMLALPRPPRSMSVFDGAVICDLSYESKDGNCRGSGGIGCFWYGPSIGWCGETYFALIPDAKSAADAHLAEYPDHIITNGADKWTLSDGLVRISKAEHDLIVAQYEVEQERAA